PARLSLPHLSPLSLHDALPICIAGVTTGQIYWGAVPFVIIQCIAVALVIAFPAMVMHYKNSGPKGDTTKPQIEIDLPPPPPPDLDRKSTRLNSSHQIISYAVFC